MATTTLTTYDNGVVVSVETVQVDDAITNRGAYRATTAQAIDTLESAWDSWATLTAGQKDATLKLAVRVVTRLARLVLGRLT